MEGKIGHLIILASHLQYYNKMKKEDAWENITKELRTNIKNDMAFG